MRGPRPEGRDWSRGGPTRRCSAEKRRTDAALPGWRGTHLCIARNTIRDQITWVAERSSDIKTDLPPMRGPKCRFFASRPKLNGCRRAATTRSPALAGATALLAPLLAQDQFLAPSRPQSRGFNTGPLGSFYGGAKFAGPPLWSLSCVAFVGHYRVDRRLSLRDHSGVITPLVSLHFVRCPHRPYGVLVTPLLNGIIARSSRFDGPKVFKDLIGLRR